MNIWELFLGAEQHSPPYFSIFNVWGLSGPLGTGLPENVWGPQTILEEVKLRSGFLHRKILFLTVDVLSQHPLGAP